jgi:hypothetical protein
MGSGMTAAGHEWMMESGYDRPAEPDVQRPPMMKAQMVAEGLCYRREPGHHPPARRHLALDQRRHAPPVDHPAGENTPLPEGVSVVPVPDMDDSGDPNDGEMTFYYTNQQSARLMFYHDHAWGITRLNVYAGEAAPTSSPTTPSRRWSTVGSSRRG